MQFSYFKHSNVTQREQSLPKQNTEHPFLQQSNNKNNETTQRNLIHSSQLHHHHNQIPVVQQKASTHRRQKIQLAISPCSSTATSTAADAAYMSPRDTLGNSPDRKFYESFNTAATSTKATNNCVRKFSPKHARYQ